VLRWLQFELSVCRHCFWHHSQGNPVSETVPSVENCGLTVDKPWKCLFKCLFVVCGQTYEWILIKWCLLGTWTLHADVNLSCRGQNSWPSTFVPKSPMCQLLTFTRPIEPSKHHFHITSESDWYFSSYMQFYYAKVTKRALGSKVKARCRQNLGTSSGRI